MKNCYGCVFRTASYDHSTDVTMYGCANGHQERMDAFTNEHGHKLYTEVETMTLECHDYPESTKKLISMIEKTDELLKLLNDDTSRNSDQSET